MNEMLIGAAALIILLPVFGTGIELGFAMAIVGFVGFIYTVSFGAALNLLGRDLYDVFSSYGYTVFPLFIMMGQLAFNSGIAVRLYGVAYKFLGHIPGGLAMATVGGATAFKALCGSSTATAATFASVAIPEMDRYGCDKRLSTGIVASVGTLGCLIPPSVSLIILGVITEQSIGKLFIAALIPGLMAAFFFVCIIYGWAKINPAIAPRAPKTPMRERVNSLPEVFWVLAIFALVVGGVMTGYFTPSEAGSVGTFGVLVLGVLKKEMNFKKYAKSLREALHTSGMLMMLVAGSTVLGHFIAVTNIPQATANWLGGLSVHPYLIMLMICLIYLLGGSFIDDLAFMILATPIFYPAVLKLGFDPIWFCVVISVTLMIGVIIPPVAICVFVVNKITKVPFGIIYRGILPFLLAMVLCGALLFIFPDLALFLPRHLGK
ncbi:MAG: TRAP transporter large permease [Syntrophorhabdaceae bacterium]|nr:TRAP transporter large permease [Syntrophorhabdaceae bacterium]